MTENLQNNEIEANKTLNPLFESEDQQNAESNVASLAENQEEKEITPEVEEKIDPIQELKEDVNTKFNQLYQLMGGAPQTSQNPAEQQYLSPVQANTDEQKEWQKYQKFREIEKYTEAQEKININIAKARQKYKDFDNKVNFNPDVHNMQGLVSVALPHENGMDILYDLVTKDQDRFEKMKRMTPIDQIKEFGKLEMLLEKKQAEKSNLESTPQVPAPLSIMKESGKSEVPGDLKSQMEKKFRKKYI